MSYYYVTFLKEVAEKVDGDNLPTRKDGSHPAESKDLGPDAICPDFEADVLNELQELVDEKARLEDLLQQISDLAGS